MPIPKKATIIKMVAFFVTHKSSGHTLDIGQCPKSRRKEIIEMIQHQKPPFPADASLAIAYVRWQELGNVYEPEEALAHGTLFPCLDKPFYGRRARYDMQTRR